MSIGEKSFFRFRGAKINDVDLHHVRDIIAANLEHPGYICTTCVHTLIDSLNDPELRAAINHSLLSLPDGTPLVWYGRLAGYRRVRRVSGPSLLASLLAGTDEFSHFLLGDTEETISAVIAKAKALNRTIRIAGYSPPFKPILTPNDNDVIFSRVADFRPDLIWVSFGGGKQDKWMYANIGNLERGLMIGVGAAFRYYIGQLKTPPRLLQQFGLQWLFRTLQDPVSVGKGQLRRFPKFLLLFAVEAIRSLSLPSPKPPQQLSSISASSPSPNPEDA